MSFRIKDGKFMMLEDSTLNFLHGNWNYYLMKIDIDVMMLFKFDFKYVKLNFKAIASIEFSFSLKLNLLCHMMVVSSWKLLKTASKKFWKIRISRVSIDQKLLSIDRVKQWPICLIRLILLVNRSNALFKSIEQRSSTNRAR